MNDRPELSSVMNDLFCFEPAVEWLRLHPVCLALPSHPLVALISCSH